MKRRSQYRHFMKEFAVFTMAFLCGGAFFYAVKTGASFEVSLFIVALSIFSFFYIANTFREEKSAVIRNIAMWTVSELDSEQIGSDYHIELEDIICKVINDTEGNLIKIFDISPAFLERAKRVLNEEILDVG